ncbi:hypothetical protein LCGC14_1779920, partial [marine sediment metagenome]
MRSLFIVIVCLSIVFPCAATVGPPDQVISPRYVPNEIIIKFHEPIANNMETQLEVQGVPNELKLSKKLDELNRRYRAKTHKPLFKNFKQRRQRAKDLLIKDKTLLTNTERRILRRLKRAPKGAKVPDLDRIYKLEVELEEGQSLQEVVAEYNNDPDVEYAELNHIVSINLAPNDPLYSQQWALPKIDAPAAWDINTGGSEVIVAVIDTGVDYTHRDLNDNMWTDGSGNYGYDFINNDNDPMDDHGHGTHCSGIISAEGNNGLDIAGVCWNAKIMALKFLGADGSGEESDGALAIYYAVENGADVTSNSYGGNEDSQAMRDAINYAYSQGVITIASAGNDNSDSPEYYPACYDNVITVAATNSGDQKAGFSNYGDWVDVAAPGVDILSLRAHGTSLGTPYDKYTTKTSGTSMACPYTAGVAALIISQYPQASADEVTIRLLGSADDISAENSGYVGLLGSGRLNTYKASLSAFDGVIHLNRDVYLCDDVISIKLRDTDLLEQVSQQVTLTSDSGDKETVTLIQDVNRPWIFTGSIYPSVDLVSVEDGLLQILHGEIITASYFDTIDSSGNSTSVYSTATVDCQGPVVSNVKLVDVLSRRVKVRLDTDEPSTAVVYCGLVCGGPYSIIGQDQELSTSHTIELIGLESETEYYFEIETNDTLGNTATEDNGGACYSFTTTSIPPPIVNVVNILSTRAEVKFKTDEPVTAVLRGGLACDGSYSITKNSSILATDHTFYLDSLKDDTDYYFVIEAVDDFDHEMLADNDGLCYGFATTPVPVPLHVPGEYPTIQAAINAATTDNTVVVADGTYTGDGNRDIDFKGKIITVKSANGPQNCIIDCQGTKAEPHRGFYFHNAEDRYSVLDGFTITNGYDWVDHLRFYRLAGGI